MNERLTAKPWRHDGYTLSKLRDALALAVRQLVDAGILDKARSVVVDFGSGDAPYRSLFEPSVARYLACDLEAGPGVDLVFEEGRPLSLTKGSADCVLSVQVLEHVWDLDAYLAECRRCLSNKGRLLLSTHGTWLYHPHPGDFRRWTRAGLIRELSCRGFEVDAVWPVVGPLAWTTQFRTLAFHYVLCRFGKIGRMLAAFLNVTMYFRMKLEDWVTPASLRETNAAVYVVMARLK